MDTPIITLVKIALVLVLTTTRVAESFRTRDIMTSMKKKETKMVFYMHDLESGKNVTSIPIAGKNGTISSGINFGTIFAIDNKVTEGADPQSKEIGRAQGIFVNSELDGFSVHYLFSVVFTDGKFNGSTIEIQGANPLMHKLREVSVVSGTGLFRFAQGFVLMETAYLDRAAFNAGIKFDVTVHHE